MQPSKVLFIQNQESMRSGNEAMAAIAEYDEESTIGAKSKDKQFFRFGS